MDLAGKFSRDIARSVASGGVALGLAVATTPIMTRLYSAEAYGQSGFVLSIVSWIASVGLLGLPMAITREVCRVEQGRIYRAAVTLAQFVVLVVGIASLSVAVLRPDIRGRGAEGMILAIPVMVGIHFRHRLIDTVAITREEFGLLAGARLANSLMARGVTLFLGAISLGTSGAILIGECLGRICSVSVVARFSCFAGGFGSDLPRMRFSEVPRVVWEYRDFALYGNLAASMPLARAVGIQGVVLSMFGAEMAGQYVLACSILSMPVTVVGLAAAPVIYQRLVRLREEGSGEMLTFALRMSLWLGLTGLCLLGPIAFFGPALFGVIFGVEWVTAGELASSLAVPQVLALVLSTMLSAYRVFRRVRAWLIMELAAGALVFIGMILVPSTYTLQEFGVWIGVLTGLSSALLLLGALWALRVGSPGGID